MAPRSTDSATSDNVRRALAVVAFTAIAATAGVAEARSPYAVAPPPETQTEGTAAQDDATTGSTEVAAGGQVAAAADEPEDMGDTTEFNLSFGSLISTGNARQIAVTGATTFLLRRGRHQFSAQAAGNYGQAASTIEADLEPTVSNIQGRLRYDIFLARRWALFTMATARHDPFQGLDLRLNIDPGAAFYILPGAKERLWTEAGYDFQFDVRTPSARLARDEDGNLLYDASGNTIQVADSTRITHAVRLFAGYFNKINDAVSFATGLEYLQSVQVARRWRLNWNTALSTLLAKKLALAVTFTARIDNDPLPRVRKVDTITALNLVYRFF